jgi:hypothetical protein
MPRQLGGIAALAAVVAVGALVLGQIVSGRGGDRGALVALFIAFLVGAFGLLATALVDAEHGVEQLSATPRWSLRAAIRRQCRRLVAAVGRFAGHVVAAIAWFARRVAAIAHNLLTGVARASRAVIVWLGASLRRERRREMWSALRQAGRTTLIALGLPPEDEARKLPNEGLDAMPTLRRERSHRTERTRHARRTDVDRFRRTIGPERRRAREPLAHRR